MGLDVLLELRGDLLRVWLESRPPTLCSLMGGTRELLDSSSLSSQLRANLSKATAGLGSQQCGALKYQQWCGVKGFWVCTKGGFENAGAGKSRLTALRLIGLTVWTSNVMFYHVQQISVPNSLRRSLK